MTKDYKEIRDIYGNLNSTESSKQNEAKYESIPKSKDNSQYEYGPLNKNPYTTKIEKILHSIINDIDKSNTSKSPNTSISLKDGNLYYSNNKTGEKDINLTDLIKNTNWSQINLQKEDLDKYAKNKAFHNLSAGTGKEIDLDKVSIKPKKDFIKNINKSIREEKFIKTATKSAYIDEEKKKNINVESTRKDLKSTQDEIEGLKSLKNLHHAEMVSINKYTGSSFSSINALSRGQYDAKSGNNYYFKDEKGDLNQDAVKKRLVDLAVVSNGLNKVHAVNRPSVIRNQDAYGVDQMIKDAQKGNVTNSNSLLSTSYHDGFGKMDNKPVDKVEIILKNVKGVNVSPISQAAGEREFLLPPSTQLKWTGHKAEEKQEFDLNSMKHVNYTTHTFTVEGANVQLKIESPARPTTMAPATKSTAPERPSTSAPDAKYTAPQRPSTMAPANKSTASEKQARSTSSTANAKIMDTIMYTVKSIRESNFIKIANNSSNSKSNTPKVKKATKQDGKFR